MCSGCGEGFDFDYVHVAFFETVAIYGYDALFVPIGTTIFVLANVYFSIEHVVEYAVTVFQGTYWLSEAGFAPGSHTDCPAGRGGATQPTNTPEFILRHSPNLRRIFLIGQNEGNGDSLFLGLAQQIHVGHYLLREKLSEYYEFGGERLEKMVGPQADLVMILVGSNTCLP